MANHGAHTITAAQKAWRILPAAWRLPNAGLMNAADADLEIASTSCELWEDVFAALVVVAVAMEFVIAFVHPTYDSFLEHWGSTFADAGIALGIVGEVQFGRKDSRIQTELRKRSNDRLAQVELDNGFLEQSAAQANERASAADQKAAEAQLALARYKAGRIIASEQWERLVPKLAKFALRRVILGTSPEGFESIRLMDHLRILFQMAQFQIETPEPSVIKERFGYTKGVLIWYVAKTEGEIFAWALTEILNAEGIFASFQPGPIAKLEPSPKPASGWILDPGKIAVIVGEQA